MIRLVRIIKLYKYLSQEKKQDEEELIAAQAAEDARKREKAANMASTGKADQAETTTEDENE